MQKKTDLSGRLLVMECCVLGLLAVFPTASRAQEAVTPTTLPANRSNQMGYLSLEDLMNMEVTSVSKSKQRLADAPAAVTVITQDDMARSGLHEIPEMLRLSPGLFVQRGNQFTGWSVASRGFGALFSDKLLTLQDGRTLYTPLFSGVYWNTVDYPIADLDRIEVIRGPGATLWGANAVNGVINITSKSARDTQGELVDSRVGTDESDLTARYGGKIDDETYYRVYGKGHSYDDMSFAPNEAGEANQWQDSRSGFRIDRYFSDRDTLTLQGDVFYQNASDRLVTGHIIPGYSHDYRDGENVLGRWTHVVSDKSDFSIQAYYDRVSLRDAYSDFKGNTFDLDFQHHFELMPNHEILYGLGTRFLTDDVGTQGLVQPVVDPTARNTYVLSAFIQDTIAIVPDRLHLTLGSKFEQNSFTGFEAQPSARLMWTPNETTSVWAAVSRAVRTPSRIEEDDAVRITVPIGGGNFGQLVKTSDHPNSEQLLAYELGLRQQVGKTFSFDVAGFFNNYDDLIVLQSRGTSIDPTEPPPVHINSSYANGQSAETYGVEVAANWQVNPTWRLAGSYSFLATFVHDDQANQTPSAAAIEDSAPRNQLQLHSYLDLTRNLEFNTSVYYVEGIGNGNVLGSVGAAPGSYVRMDLGVTWRPKPGLELSAGVQNAFDPHHLEASFNADSSSEIDRAVYAQLTWRH